MSLGAQLAADAALILLTCCAYPSSDQEGKGIYQRLVEGRKLRKGFRKGKGNRCLQLFLRQGSRALYKRENLRAQGTHRYRSRKTSKGLLQRATSKAQGVVRNAAEAWGISWPCLNPGKLCYIQSFSPHTLVHQHKHFTLHESSFTCLSLQCLELTVRKEPLKPSAKHLIQLRQEPLNFFV